MKRIMVVSVVCVALCLAWMGTSEAIETGRDLAQMCAEGKTTEQLLRSAFCAGYIDGFLESYRVSMIILDVHAPTAQQPVCLPDRGVHIGQVRALIVDWLKRYPNDRQKTAPMVVYHVLMAAWPCETMPVNRK
jgi:Rap1a immunity proteins